MHVVMAVLVTLFSLATVAAGIIAVVRPTIMSKSQQVGSGEQFYAMMYASRAIPLGLLAAAAPFTLQGLVLQLILSAAALAQLGDAAIGFKRREWGMVAFPMMLAILYGVAASAVFTP